METPRLLNCFMMDAKVSCFMVNNRKNTVVLILALIQLVATPHCYAEIYEYTDSNNVIHFTDDASKIPKKWREKSIKSTKPSLTAKESKTLDALIEIENDHDVPAKNLSEFKKNLNNFADGFKEELGDPAEPLDSRLSTPEGALNLFRTGLKTGDMNAVKASVTGKYWTRVEGLNGLSKANLIQMEKLISDRSITKKQLNKKYTVFELKENTSIIGTVELINVYGNWKIEQF